MKYQNFLIEQLKNPDESLAYLNAALKENLEGDEESQHIFLIALHNIAEAQRVEELGI